MKKDKIFLRVISLYFAVYSLINLIYYSGITAKVGAILGIIASIYLSIKSFSSKRK